MNQEILKEIKNWKVEAKLEDSDRYFYHIEEINNLLNGDKSYVIGRKGTGKTAISEYLNKLKDAKIFSQKLTFKHFPFNAMYELENSKYSSPNQYITIWKYVIYNTLAKLFIKNENISLPIRSNLEKIYGDDLTKGLSRAVSKWTSASFSVNILGNGFQVGGEKKDSESKLSWIEKVDILEDFILKNIDDSSYLIIFDELDEDYKDITSKEKYERYTQLLTGLFKAVQDIKSIFMGINLFPVVFLRDDIYDILKDPDKTKWDDLKINLGWNIDSLKNLVAFRLSRAIEANSNPLSFKESWNSIFSARGVSYGNRKNKSMDAFDYIARNTHLRPRDFVKYIQLCSEQSLIKHYNKIKPDVIATVNNQFSEYLRSELEDEIQGILPEIHEILDIFSILRKQTLKISEFIEIYDEYVNEGKLKKRDAVFILKVLYLFSVIGGQPKQKTYQVYRYTNSGTSLNMNDNIILHRGLYRSLQIL